MADADSSTKTDIRGLLSDPRFNSLDTAQQKQVLGRIDSRFSGLSDGEYLAFRKRVPVEETNVSFGKRAANDPLPRWNQFSERWNRLERMVPGIQESDENAGLRQLGRGAKELLSAEFSKGGSDILEGAMDAGRGAVYAIAPLAPFATAGGLASGALAGEASKYASKYLGLSKDQARLVGDIIGIYTGGKVGAKIASTSPPEGREAARNLPKVSAPVRAALRMMFPRGADALLRAYDALAGGESKALGRSDLSAAVKRGGISLEDYRAELLERGYSERDAKVMADNLAKQMEPKPAKPAEYEPAFRPNPRTAARMKFGGRSEPEYGPGSRASTRPTVRPSERAGDAETRYIQHLRDRGPATVKEQGETLAKWIRAKGVTSQDRITPEEWQMYAASAGVNGSPEVISTARGQLPFRRGAR